MTSVRPECARKREGRREDAGGVAARPSQRGPCEPDDQVRPRYCHPAAWNVHAKAGIVAAILGHEGEGHSWGERRGAGGSLDP